MWNIRKTVKKGDYLYAVVPEHPKATAFGYVLLHRIVVENHLGRLLRDDEIVHHVDENKMNNLVSNLEVTDASSHATAHGLAKGKLAVRLRCPNCAKVFVRIKRDTHLQKGGNATFCARTCSTEFNANKRRQGLTQEATRALAENLVAEFRLYE